MRRPGRIPAAVRWGLVALVAAASLLLGAAPARAHSELLSSDPANGAHLDHLPTLVRLTFGEPVLLDGARIDLLVGGTTEPLVDLALDRTGKVLTAVPAMSVDEAASVTFRWAVVSSDGHPVGGDIGVGIGAALAPATKVARPARDPRLVDDLVITDRMVGYLGMTLLCGGLVFLAAVWPEGVEVTRSRTLLWGAWAAGLLAAVAAFGLQAATLRGGDLGAATDAGALASVFDSPFGRAWGARTLLFVLAIPVLVALGRGGRAIVRTPWFLVSAAAVAIGLLRTPGFVAHASEGDMGVLGSIADLAHLIGVATWMGGLVFLSAVVLPRRRTGELRRVVPAFSRLAFGAIVVIVLGGTVMTWELAGSFDALRTTEWGRLLLLKVGLFTTILGVARLSKRWVDDRLGLAVALRGHLLLVRPFVLSVAAETLLAASVLGVASVLVTTSPGR